MRTRPGGLGDRLRGRLRRRLPEHAGGLLHAHRVLPRVELALPRAEPGILRQPCDQLAQRIRPLGVPDPSQGLRRLGQESRRAFAPKGAYKSRHGALVAHAPQEPRRLDRGLGLARGQHLGQGLQLLPARPPAPGDPSGLGRVQVPPGERVEHPPPQRRALPIEPQQIIERRVGPGGRGAPQSGHRVGRGPPLEPLGIGAPALGGPRRQLDLVRAGPGQLGQGLADHELRVRWIRGRLEHGTQVPGPDPQRADALERG